MATTEDLKQAEQRRRNNYAKLYPIVHDICERISQIRIDGDKKSRLRYILYCCMAARHELEIEN